MSFKTLRKRIALVATASLGFGLLSVVPASAATYTATFISGSTTLTGTTTATASATVATGTSVNFAVLVTGSDTPTAADTYTQAAANTLLDAKQDKTGTVADATLLEDGFLKTPAGKGYAFAGPAFTDVKYFGDGVGIAVRKGDALKDKINAAIAGIRENGKYKQIQDKYFNFDIYGQ